MTEARKSAKKTNKQTAINRIRELSLDLPMSIIKLENLLGSENWTEWFEGLAPEEATKFLSLGEEAWKKLDSIGTDDLLSWQILYELDDGQWEALQSMGLAQSLSLIHI